MANCRACTAPLEPGAVVCPACDEPVSGVRAPKPAEAESAPDSETRRPEKTPGNDAMLALTAGVGALALAFLPCLCSSLLLGLPGSGLALGCAGVAVWKGSSELEAIERGEAPEAGEKVANAGRLLGFAGGALTAVTLVGSLAWSLLRARFLHR